MTVSRLVLWVGLTLAPAGLLPGSSVAETLPGALGTAYMNNPTINAVRAEVRATDEGVPLALSGYRPVLSGSADVGVTDTNKAPVSYPYGYSITIEQPLFRGHRTSNDVNRAESAVLAGREALRRSEQDLLLDAVGAYMNVIRDDEILGLTGQNIQFLREQVRAANDRLEVGEGTRTDVAQTDARLSAGISDENQARANLNASIAVYVQVIGGRPKNLEPGRPVDHMLPATVEQAMETAQARHPAIAFAEFNVDVAAFNVKIIEGELLPSVSLSGTYSYRDSSGPGGANDPTTTGSLVGKLSVPLYSGGSVSARTRQAKERLTQRRIEVDAARDLVQAQVVSAWGTLVAARAQVVAAEAQVRATRLALEGIVEERNVGQRTTLDVLDAQAEVLSARISLSGARRNRVVASYALLAAVGGLDAASLALDVVAYDPTHHYGEVRDKWHGLRTPDGR